MRVRHFTEWAVIGSKIFVNEFFDVHKKLFDVKRKDGARRISETDGDLHSLRDLKRQVQRDSK